MLLSHYFQAGRNPADSFSGWWAEWDFLGTYSESVISQYIPPQGRNPQPKAYRRCHFTPALKCSRDFLHRSAASQGRWRLHQPLPYRLRMPPSIQDGDGSIAPPQGQDVLSETRLAFIYAIQMPVSAKRHSSCQRQVTPCRLQITAVRSLSLPRLSHSSVTA